ncbi:hypothetical protein HK097_002098 [Rhizophlyctis rosea]|uniref:Uncharacterized protein n=1 Tax=Rhizophlyctis rosea TaxID=64517 RepID=A0AAD5X1G4_9FUNG|nr:hypothetical protein HK097_002098 [Rhizophlyctis rosea]
MFILGPFVAALPFMFYATRTIPSEQNFIGELEAFTSIQISARRNCKLCSGITCKRCSKLGSIYTRVTSRLNFVRYVKKDMYCLCEATTSHGDKFFFKGGFNCWRVDGFVPRRPEREGECRELKEKIEGYLGMDTFRLQCFWYAYLALSVWLLLRFRIHW